MSAIDVQVRFAAEFALFLVSLAGLGFSFLRADLLVIRPVARAASMVGFAALAAAALLSGSLIVDSPTEPAVVALRFAGIVLLAGSSLSWRPDRVGRNLLRIGLLALVVAEVLLAGDEASTWSDAARVIGALAVGACLLGASARVISARIAASGAMVVFAVITVVAVALSAVVSDNVEDQALRRYGARAETEADAMEAASRPLLASAHLISVGLAQPPTSQQAAAIQRVTDTTRDVSGLVEDRQIITLLLTRLVDAVVADQDPLRGPTLLVNRDGYVPVVDQAEPNPDLLLELPFRPVVQEALQGKQTVGVVLVGDDLLAVAADPLLVGGRLRGVVVRTTRLDTGYLRVRSAPIVQEVAGAGLAIVDRDSVLSDSGTRTDPSLLRTIGRAALDAGDDLDRAIAGRFIVARPVVGDDGAPVAALIISAPRTQEDATREDLFRVLFLVAMGAATAALVLAGVVGNRIGAGLRRLTDAAAAIQGGNLGARANVTTDDELGDLGRSFDAMAASLGDLTLDLRTAAIDEAELRGRLEAVFAGMGEALVAVDADGEITDFNAAAEELFDLPARDARGKLAAQVLHLRSEDGTNISRRLRRPVLEPWSESGSIRISGGRDVPVVVSAGALRSASNEVTGAVFLFRDERRERELERMKTEFLSNISHELRTPLTPIKGFASILRTRDLPAARARGFAEEISDAADQLERVIGQLVNFSTIVGGRLAIAPEPLAVRPLLDGVVKRWRERLTDGHKLARRVQTGMPRVVADPTYLVQAVDELLGNAVKYSPNGGKIVLSASVVDGEDGPELEISVTDEGVGIPADRLDTVLEEFAQADSSATRRFGGLGLGLALVARLARAHEGHVRIASTPGEGTTAAIRVPVDGPAGVGR